MADATLLLARRRGDVRSVIATASLGLAMVLIAASCASVAESSVADGTAVDKAEPEAVEVSCGELDPGLHELELVAAGVTRTYRLAIPAASQDGEPLPLVFDFHGAGSNAAQQSRVSGFEALGEIERFAVATPQGVEGRWSAADVRFIDELLDEIDALTCIDATSVFAAGMSNGGFFSAILACRLPDRFAAIATVTGISFPRECQPDPPVPIVHFHGTHDQIVLFEPIEESITSWSDAYGCGPADSSAVTDDVELRSFGGCQPGAALDFYVVSDAGHTWPGSAETLRFEVSLGQTTTDIDATAIAWDWFRFHGTS